MARVFIGVGHGGSDPGAVGHVVEKDAALNIALETKRILESYGNVVGISRTWDEEGDLNKEINMANAFGPDLAMEIHLNAGRGDGFEVWVQTNRYESESRRAARCVEARVEELGQYSRGLKTKQGSHGDYFGWLRRVDCPAILTEGFFVDSDDAYDFDTPEKQKKLAEAYAFGALDYLGISTESGEELDDSIRGVYEVTANSGLNLRGGAYSSADVRETMPHGSTCLCYGLRSGDWFYVESESGRTGYCHKDYLKLVLPFVDVFASEYYFDAVKWAIEKGITAGKPNNKFNPKDICTRAEAVQMIYAYYGKRDLGEIQKFDDVSESDWFYKAAHWARDKRITDGAGDNKFSPNAPCTRAQVITMMWRGAGSPDVDCELRFVDVKETDYFYKAVKWAKKNGITAGVDATYFAPHDPCSRAQMVMFLYKK